MAAFYCNDCNLSFEDTQKQKKEYHDYIYGPCWKYIAYCPHCGGECTEKLEPKPGKSKPEVQLECGSGSCQGPACSRFQ